MNTYFTFLDIDGTLIDQRYDTNFSGLKDQIETLQNVGHVFALNSNRALEDLLPIAEQFGIGGPLVGENGIFFVFPQSNETVYLLDEDVRNKLVRSKFEVEEMIKKSLQKLSPEGELLWESVDTVNEIKLSKMRYSEDSVVVLNNMYRKFTISAHIKKSVNGLLVHANDVIEQILPDLRLKIEARYPKLVVTYSPLFANILVYPRMVSKKSAVLALKETYYRDYAFAAIGDEMSDYLMIDGIGAFYTTANANNDVKEHAISVSEYPYTHGVSQLLNQYIT